MVTRVPLRSLPSFFLVLRPRPLTLVVVAVVLALLFERARGLVAVVDGDGGVVAVDCFVIREVAAVALEMPRIGSLAVVAVAVVEAEVVLAVSVEAAP